MVMYIVHSSKMQLILAINFLFFVMVMSITSVDAKSSNSSRSAVKDTIKREHSNNILYNSSFEITTNPDIPDGWARDYALPPWGYDIYSIDRGNSFHGSKSIRLGFKGKCVRSWGRHTKITIGHHYTFSVYLKADRNHVSVSLDLANVDSKRITVNKEWKRFFLTGIAKKKYTRGSIHLKSDGVLWVDAVQLEEGLYPSDYVPSESDYQNYDDILKVKYKRRYARAFKANQYSPVKMGSKKEKIFDLVGTEYNFYTTESKVRVRCFLNELIKSKKKAKLSWYLEKDGFQIDAPHEADLKLGENEWAFDIGGLDYGVYELKVIYIKDNRTIIQKKSKFSKLPPSKHEVRINRWGRFLVVDGRPFFFYGFFDNLSRGSMNRWEIALQEMKRIDCNGILNYVGGIKQYNMLDQALDDAHKNNQKVFVHLGWMLSYFLPKYAYREDRFNNEEEALTKLRDVVMKYKQHPALLGWATLDEPDNRPNIFTKELTEKYYRLIKEIDPYHPCIISHISMLGESMRYSAATDIAVIPYSNRPYYDDLFSEYWNLGIPVFTNSTCIGALGRTMREPTPAEQRVRLYKAIVMGARGLCTYTFRCNSMNTWKEFGTIGNELKTLAPILLSTGNQSYLFNIASKYSEVKALLKAYKGRYYIIAVNTGEKTEEVLFNLKDVGNFINIKAMFNSPAAIFDQIHKNVNFVMPTQSVAIYQLH